MTSRALKLAAGMTLVALALVAALPISPRSLGALDAFTVAAAIATLVACWLASERVLALAPAFNRLRSATR